MEFVEFVLVILIFIGILSEEVVVKDFQLCVIVSSFLDVILVVCEFVLLSDDYVS